MNKQYIGDGVYVEYNDYTVTLTTEDGEGITNRIILEADVLNNLNEYLKVMFKSNLLAQKVKE